MQNVLQFGVKNPFFAIWRLDNLFNVDFLFKCFLFLITGIKAYKCEECGQNFSTSSGRKGHIKVVHLGIKPFACHLCPFKCANKGDVEKHIQTVHTNIPFPCRFCDQVFNSNRTLQRHTADLHAPVRSLRQRGLLHPEKLAKTLSEIKEIKLKGPQGQYLP